MEETRHRTRTVVSVAAWITMGAATLALIADRAIVGREPVAIGLQVAAGLLMLWSRLTFGRRSFHGAASPTAGGLVTNGPYRYVRNPIYASIVLFVVAGVADHASWLPAALAAVVVVGALARAFVEEAELRERYPEYGDYAAHTARFIPFVW